MHDLSVLSFDSSIISENGLSVMLSKTFAGANAFLTIAVVFVRPQENLFAIAESGNSLWKRLFALSDVKKAKLCFATNNDQRASASICSLLVCFLKIELTEAVNDEAAAYSL